MSQPRRRSVAAAASGVAPPDIACERRGAALAGGERGAPGGARLEHAPQAQGAGRRQHERERRTGRREVVLAHAQREVEQVVGHGRHIDTERTGRWRPACDEVAHRTDDDAEDGLSAQTNGHDGAAPHLGGEVVGHEVVERLLESPGGEQRDDGSVHGRDRPSV